MKKKGIKRLLAMVFAFVLMFSCMGTAWADGTSETGSIEITNVQSSGHKFYAYQIFSGTTYKDTTSTEQSKYILSDIEWGSGVSEARTNPSDDTETISIYTDLAVLEDGNAYPFADCATAAEVAAVLANYNDDSGMLVSFAEVISNYILSSAKIGSATESGTTGDYTYTISGLADGYYFVQDEATDLADGDAYTRYIVQVVGQAEISTKAVYPTVAKTIVESDGTETNATSASAGDTVTFKLEGTIPDLTSYSSYTFKFVDTLSNNLTYGSSDNNMKVVAKKYTEADVTSGFDNSTTYYTYNNSTGMYEEVGTDVTSPVTDTTYYVVSATQELYDSTDTANTSTYTYTKKYGTDNKTLTISIDNIVENKFAGYTITVTYDATLAGSVVASTAETNTVYIEYSDNPNDSSTSETTKHKVYVYTFDLNVLKKDGNNSGLAGAKFTLYKEVSVTSSTFSNGTYYAYADGSMTKASTYDSGITYYEVVDSDVEAEETTIGSGTYQATFNDLGEGTYVLVETTTPDGYNTADPIEFTITATYAADGDSINTLTSNNDDVTTNGSTTTLSTTVINKAGSTLPETGGRGTTMFYIIGGILVFGAAVLLITRRRMGREE